MTEEQILRQALEQNFHTQEVRCCLASKLWIIEIIINGLDQNKRGATIQSVQNILATTSVSNKNIWKLFIYGDRRQRFNVDGMLHVNQPTYTSDGIYVVTLGFLRLRALDN